MRSNHRLCWSLPRQNNASNFYIRNSRPLARILNGPNQFEFYLAEKPERRFSRYEAQMINIERAGTGQHKMSNEPHREITNEMVCTPSKDSDQPGHPPSLIRVFTVRLKIDRFLSYSLSAQTLIKLGIHPLQADLSLRWAHIPIRWFCHDAAQIKAELFLEMTQWKNLCLFFHSERLGQFRESDLGCITLDFMMTS